MTTSDIKTPVDHPFPDWVSQEGLDSLGIGLFRLDAAGNLVQYNDTAAAILGVDRNGSWDDKHISHVDRVLGTGLAAEVDNIVGGGSRFVRKGLRCTNRHGRFMELDLFCMRTGDDDEPGVVGITHDAHGCREQSGELANLRQELQILSDVAAALSSSRELSQILKVILTGATASQGLGFNRAFLFLYDEDHNCLRGHLACGPSSAEEAGYIWSNLDAQRLSLGELLDTNRDVPEERSDHITDLISGYSISLEEQSQISDACATGRWVNLESIADMDPVTAGFSERLGTPRFALVPMVSKGRLRGLLAADNYITQRPISEADVQVLHILANQAAVAMERARLYDAQIERAEELEKANRLLAESQDQIIKFEKMSVIGQLTSAIAHELRNPLTIVGGFANLMLKADSSDEHREYLNIIASETRRAESVLDHVLDFSKASQSESTTIDFSRLVRRNLSLLMGRLHGHAHDIAASYAGRKLIVWGNNDHLSHAVYQFLRLVAEDIIPPGSAEVRTEGRESTALMWVKIHCDEADRTKATKTLQQVFTENRTSQRLTILVAGETIKYHGGNYGLAFSDDGAPMLYVELPLAGEKNYEAANPGD